ncbi:MAG: hypothetical protein ABIT58_02000 [Ferruginibacter sp.]
MDWWHVFTNWFLSLGEKYGVNPYIFGAIYIGAIPLFFLCLAWTVKKMKQKKPFVLPLLLTGLCFISAYVYLIIAGKNIPFWVYIFIGVMVVYGIFSTIHKIMKQAETE